MDDAKSAGKTIIQWFHNKNNEVCKRFYDVDMHVFIISLDL
jgi:hypothetical protein